MTNKLLSTISILHSMRRKHEKVAEYNFVAFYAFLGIFLLDIIFIFATSNNNLNTFGWLGIWLLLLAMGFTLKEAYNERSWIDAIDGFYLEKSIKK